MCAGEKFCVYYSVAVYSRVELSAVTSEPIVGTVATAWSIHCAETIAVVNTAVCFAAVRCCSVHTCSERERY
jgi:hypothetical protein